MKRRDFLWQSATGFWGGLASAAHISKSVVFRSDRLDQGPFLITQDDGWQTILFTTPASRPIRNPGLGLVGYAWEENGPSQAVRRGQKTLAASVEELAALPFVDCLYIRCDWRDVQKQPGSLDLHPVWQITRDAAKEHGLRIAFRVQMSTPERQPKQLALPDFLQSKVPLVEIGPIPQQPQSRYREPRYDHPAFQKAWRELNDLLAEQFDGDPLIEWVDIMQYGFWGEGHTGRYPHPFPDDSTAQRTLEAMTQHQLSLWKRTPLAINTQPDISHVGNQAVITEALAAGAWLRSDSIIIEEPEQIAKIVSRPLSSAAILEDGYLRNYDVTKLKQDSSGVNILENYMLHTLDLKANYWSLWTEAENLKEYNHQYPRGFQTLQANLGYRLRPAWVWQRKRENKPEIIVGIANRGVSSVPGTLHLILESSDGSFRLRGTLDEGKPEAASTHLAAFRLPKYVSKINLRAEIELRPGNLRPIIFSCEQPTNQDGSISIDLKGIDDQGWRKGV